MTTLKANVMIEKWSPKVKVLIPGICVYVMTCQRRVRHTDEIRMDN